MSLYDESTKIENEEKRSKMKKMVLVAIIIVCILIFVIIGLIIYMAGQPSDISINIDGKANSKLLELVTIKTDESGNIELDEDGYPVLYAPIKKVASYFGYDDNNGNYMTVSEDTDSCNVKNENEVAIFTLDSDIILKKDLTNSNSGYETYTISEKVFKDSYIENEKQSEELYTNREGLELAFNIYIYYNSETNTIDIYTLDYYVTLYTGERTITDSKTGATQTTTYIEQYGYSKLDEKFVNQKAILDNMLVVINEEGKYGIISLSGEKIFGSQYDSLTYIPESQAFLVESNQKYGIILANGETKIKPVYNSLQLIDNDKQLYLVNNGSKYGIIDIDSNIIVPLEYEKIGIDITKYGENNLTNGYIIQDTLIPVQQDKKWGLFDLKGNIVGEGVVYDSIGCLTKSSIGTAYNVLSIPEYNAIVVEKNEKYGCINLKGKTIVSFVADDVYMQISSGVTKYIMTQTKDDKIYTKDISELIK